MHVVMLGAGNPPTTFISRQIDALRAVGARVTTYLTTLSRWRLRLALKTSQQALLPAAAQTLLESADVLHFQWPTDILSYRRIAQLMHHPTVVSLRGRLINLVPYMPGREAYRRQLERYLGDCHGYHAVSKAIIHEAVGFGINQRRAIVIYTLLMWSSSLHLLRRLQMSYRFK